MDTTGRTDVRSDAEMTTPVETLNYEAAASELDQIIERLERGSFALDDAIAAYERGNAVAAHCAALLDRTEQRVSQLVINGQGGVAEKPLEPISERAEKPAGARQSTINPDDIPF